MTLKVLDIDGAPPSPVVGATGGLADVVKEVTFDSSYPTGGLALTPAMFGLASFLQVDANPSAAGYLHPFDYTNGKLLAMRSGAANGVLVEETATTSLATVVTRVWARGKRL